MHLGEMSKRFSETQGHRISVYSWPSPNAYICVSIYYIFV